MHILMPNNDFTCDGTVPQQKKKAMRKYAVHLFVKQSTILSSWLHKLKCKMNLIFSLTVEGLLAVRASQKQPPKDTQS